MCVHNDDILRTVKRQPAVIIFQKFIFCIFYVGCGTHIEGKLTFNNVCIIEVHWVPDVCIHQMLMWRLSHWGWGGNKEVNLTTVVLSMLMTQETFACFSDVFTPWHIGVV